MTDLEALVKLMRDDAASCDSLDLPYTAARLREAADAMEAAEKREQALMEQIAELRRWCQSERA